MKPSRILGSLARNRLLVWTLILILFHTLSRFNYPLYHNLAELFTIIVASSIFLIAWNARMLLQQHFILFIGIGFSFVVLFNTLHVLSFTGMSVFPGDTGDLTNQLFIITQFYTAFTLLIAPVFLKRRLNSAPVFAIFTGISLLIMAALWTSLFPPSYRPGTGFTGVGAASGYLVSLILIAAILYLQMNRHELANRVFTLTRSAIALAILSSLTFALFPDMYGFTNFIGHFLRILSFYFLYKAIVVTSLVEPYKGLFLKLRKSEQRYRSFYNTAPLAFVVWDTNRRIIGWNKTAEQIFGWSESEVLGRDFFDLIIPENAREHVNDIVESLLRGTSANRSINQNITKDGKIIVCEWSNQVLRDSEGAVESILSLGLDITEQKAAEQALEDSSEKIKKFAYFVAHDLKNPAITLYGLSKLLKKQYGDSLDERGRNLADQIMKTAEQIGVLVDEINTFITTRELPMQIQDVDLDELVQLIEDEFSLQLASRGIALTRSVGMPSIRTERLSVLRALRNMVDNALKYGGEQLSEIHIGYRDSGDRHIILVRDNGIGLREEDLQRVFGPFVREAGPRGVHGTGLGLAIVREFAQRLNGTVWADSEYGKGVTFYIALPKNI